MKTHALISVFIALASIASALENRSSSTLNSNYKSAGTYDLKEVPEETIAIFYDMAMKEYYGSNFGYCADMLTAITEKTDKYPMAFFYLAKIYKDVPTMINHEKSKGNILCFIELAKEAKMDSSFITSSYDDLIDMERSPELCMKYARMALGVASDMMSIQCMAKASEKMFYAKKDNQYLEMHGFYSEKNRRIFEGNTNIEYIIDADTPMLRGGVFRVAGNDKR